MKYLFPASLMLAHLKLLVAVGGCGGGNPDYRDQRLAEFAEQAVEQQAKQNEHIAQQSKAVVEATQELAQASHDLVEQDAQARRELLTAQEQRTFELDQQRDQLEQERREIAHARHRDPIIAATVSSVGVLIACLVPLLVCVYVLWQMSRAEPDDRAVAELLVQEFTADRPLVLPDRIDQPATDALPAVEGTKRLPK